MRQDHTSVSVLMKRVAVTVSIALFLFAGGTTARADKEEEAHAKAAQGEDLLSANKFADAARRFEEAHNLHPLPLYLRKLGDALRGAKDCGGAITAYQRYRKQTKDATVARDIQACKISLAKRGAGRGADQIAVLVRTGKYLEALRMAKSAAQGSKAARPWAVLGEIELLLGRDQAARSSLQKALKLDPKQHRARRLFAIHLVERGNARRGKALLDRFFDFYSAGEIKSAADLTEVALAMKALERWHDAHRVFGEALKADKGHVEAHVAWGRLLLTKYNVGEALQTIQDGLKIDPDSPDANTAVAEAYLTGRYDVPKALKAVKKALKVNPDHLEGRVVLASVHLWSEQVKEALKEVDRVLTINPRHRGALAMKAAALYLGDRSKEFAETVRAANKVKADNGAFYLVVAKHAALFHRYEEAVDLLEKGLKRDTDFWPAYQELGLNYLRMGKELRAKKYLEKAWAKDPFNVRTKNILDLYEESIQNYRFALTAHFRIRFHKKDLKVLKRYVAAHLERAYRDMRERYGFKPKGPITVELFARSDDFAVRTVGLPRLASLGVCFGRVVTSMSPRARRRFNWGQVLWHELNHVFTLQLSRARVPRWLTEGLAVYEEGKGHPSWAREMDERMRQMLVTKRLRKITELNLGFTRARSVSEIILAYYQAAHAAEFLVERVGQQGVVRMLRGFGKGKNLPELLLEVGSMKPADFDKQFKEWLSKKLGHLLKNFELDYEVYKDLTKLEKRTRKSPKDAEAWAALAAGRFRAKKISEAEEASDTALRLNPKDPLANFIAGELAVYRKKYDDAISAYEKVLAAGKDGYDLRRSLALLYRRKKLTEKTRTHLAAMKRLNPQALEPYGILAQLYTKAGEKERAIAELEHLGRHDHKSAPTLSKLVRHWAKKGDPSKVAEFGRLMMYLTPFQPNIHLELGRALGALGKADDALAELQAALDTGYKDPAEVQVEIAQIHLGAGRRTEAKAAAQKALKADPNSTRAKEILAQAQ